MLMLCDAAVKSAVALIWLRCHITYSIPVGPGLRTASLRTASLCAAPMYSPYVLVRAVRTASSHVT